MADCLISPVKEIGKCILTQCLWPPIKSHFDYWWCFHNNIQGLRDEIRDLDRETLHISQKIEEARLRTENLCPGVEEWFKACTDKLSEARNILPDDNIPKACNLISRYSVGKNAKKTAEEIVKLRNDGNFNPIAYPAPSPAMGFASHRSTMDFESRKHIEEEIIDSLKQSSVGVIGICGMGGIGKTTMAQRIVKRVKEENLFDEVVMVTVSQKIDMLKIQEEIAEWLKLKFDEKHMSTRAAKLRTRLMDAKRKIIILDDVWESLRFEDLGIPIESNFERCIVLLTSRSRDTCKGIKNKKVFELKFLEEGEASNLFREKAGKCVEDSVLHPVAKAIVAECKGLPIALVTVGLALQDDTNIYKWEDSLSQLKQGNPTDFPEVLANVYKPLKLSYDYLDNDSERYLFLMCCMFPEDYDIPIELLTLYSMGLRLFDGISNIKEARNRTHRLVEKLNSRFLLICGMDKLHVKMHDVARDVAIYIGSKQKNGFLKSLTSIKNSSDLNCNWISVDISNERMEVPLVSLFPKLQLLMLLKSRSKEFSGISYEGMKDLNVLAFLSSSIGSLPPTLGSLKNLQTLCLFYCEVENISVIGELTSLKIFSCNGCYNIAELPAEIGSLSGLRLLELSLCRLLQKIPFGIISSLSRLEELRMRGSFTRWEAEENGKERRNASLRELECLPNLSCLEIEIDDCTLSAQEICLSLNLVKYYIRIGSEYDYYHCYYFEERDYEKVMILNLGGAVGNWIRLLSRNAESLSLRGDGSDNINLAEIENLRKLKFTNCSTVKKLVDTKDEEICYRNQNVSLFNLKFIHISQCSNLKHLFSVSEDRTSLLQLEVLEIRDCESMEQVFWNEGTDDNTDGCIEFPKLKELTLSNLPNLTAFCQGLENIIIKFPNLTQMRIYKLPKLNSPSLLNSETLENTCFHLFCNPKDVSFCNLKSIHINSCSNLRHLFSVSAARKCLLQLEVLEIENCAAMEQVFWNEVRDDNTSGCIEFPKLKQLTLKDLPNLTAFCQGLESNIIKFPNLTHMWIRRLPTLKNSVFPLISEIHGNLKSIKIGSFSKLRSLFSLSVARTSLLQLEALEIEYCDSMEQVFWNEGTNDNTDGCIEFSKLKELTLRNLPNLTAFCQGLEKFPNLTQMNILRLPKLNSLSPLNSETLENTCFHFACNPKDVSLCNLKSIYISGCSNLKHVFSVSAARRCLLQLEVLEIEDCESMEQVFWNEGTDTDDNTDGCIEFSKLKELTLRNLPNLRAFWQGLENIIIETFVWHNQKTCFHFVRNLKDVSFCNLKSINISGCEKLIYLFSVSAARRCLFQLEVFRIGYCWSMEQVFWNEVRYDNTDGCIEFPKLMELTLYYLPNLTSFCQGLENIIIKFPNLTQMKIERLRNLNSLFPQNSETLHDQTTPLHFVCNPKVEMGLLKYLSLSNLGDNVRNIWCHQIPNDVFNNLEALHISFMNGIRSLMSTSIAKNLVSLKRLEIKYCDKMVEVIERDDDDKQVVDINCLFPNLRQLEISDLDKWRRFWQWNHALELPLLEEVVIFNCPMMETFTLGSINTPNIRKIKLGNQTIEDQIDLNDVIRHIWTESQDTSKAKEDADEDEDEDEDGSGGRRRRRRRTRTRMMRMRMKTKMNTTMTM